MDSSLEQCQNADVDMVDATGKLKLVIEEQYPKAVLLILVTAEQEIVTSVLQDWKAACPAILREGNATLVADDSPEQKP